MTKNLTLSLPDELDKSMNKFPEVNWSAVARDAIETYVRLREKPDLGPLVERLIQSRGRKYVSGVAAAKVRTDPAKGIGLEQYRYQRILEAILDSRRREPTRKIQMATTRP